MGILEAGKQEDRVNGLAVVSSPSGLNLAQSAETSVASGAPVVVIGGGPVGIKAAQELVQRGFAVTLFNAERWQPYNRVKLTPLLAGDVQFGQVYLEPNFPEDARFVQYTGHPIIEIDTKNKTVTGQTGRKFPYTKLVIATGSRAHIPNIKGIDRDGVFKFRDFDDTEKLVARSVSARRAAVIGGGLLGLEAARGMATRGVETFVVEHERRLMARQLDQAGGELLAKQIESIGLTVLTGCAVREITGNGRVEGIEFSNGQRLSCDTIIVCTGIRANMEMALEAGLAVGRGIKVNERLECSLPDIYAVGECAEFDGNVYGLVGPGLEQAIIAAKCIAGEEASYAGSLPSTKLKVVGSDVFSMGDVEQLSERIDIETVAFEQQDKGYYRKLVLKKGRLVGALAIGDWPEINVLQKAIQEHSFLWPWQLRRFRKSGLVYGDKEPASVLEWPAAATVCNCTGVTRGQIGDAIQQGCVTFDAVQRETSASTVCGSCRPLINELISGKPKYEPIEWWRPVAVLSVAAALLGLLILLLPAWPMSGSVQDKFQIDILWRDGFWKQVSGFSLLALSVFAAVISLRKNFKWLSFGGYASWRLLHVAVGLTALIVLFLHTGFRLGNNLNFWLMSCFLFLGLIGAAAGAVKAFEHQLNEKIYKRASAKPAKLPIWLHIFALWPLPLLLALHIFSVYYY